MRALASLCVCLALWLLPSAARANVLQAPVGGASIPVGPGLVVCAAGGGWVSEANGAQLRPPSADTAAGSVTRLRVAPSWGACAQSKATITLVATGHFPALDPGSITLFVDEGRVEARGKNLRGAQIHWSGAGKTGVDVCWEPKADASGQSCSWAVSRDLSADPGADTLRLLPAFAQLGDERVLYDAAGQAVLGGGVPAPPSRLIVARLLASDSALDLSMGRGEVPLLHAEALAAVDCGALDCQLVSSKVIVSSTAPVVTAELRLRLLPRVLLQRRGVLEEKPSFKLPVVHCAMTLVSGLPVRRNDDAKLVVRLEARCLTSRDLYRFSADDSPLRVLASAETSEGVFALLELGSYAQNELEISARRSDTGAVVAALTTPTRALPGLRATVELPGYPRIDFIPTNRPAWVNVSRLPDDEYWELVSIDNVYTANHDGKRMSVIGDPDAEGFTALEFALRKRGLPDALGGVDLARVNDSLQRKVQEANVPVPFGAATTGARPLVEFHCGPPGKSVALQPGDPVNLPFAWRDTCRLTVHPERLRRENGRQLIDLSIDVFSADGLSRSEGHVKDTLELAPGGEARQIWIQGIQSSFDRVVVRLSHESGDHHYVAGSSLYSGGPAVQWSAILGTGHARIYATSAIPAGLYRFGDKDHSGLLSLNFGVISRLTWLSSDGHEGLIGLEAGLMVIGLANSVSTTGRSLTEVGVPVGLGLSVPIANRLSAAEASINLHGWVEFPISRGEHSPAFIFGPSISIGNVGANL